MTETPKFVYARRVRCEVCQGATAIPVIGCYKCHGNGYYQVARLGRVDEWYPNDIFHLPPHTVPLQVKEMLTHKYDSGPKQELRTTAAWFDCYLWEFHNEWGELRGEVMEWMVDGELLPPDPGAVIDPAKCLGVGCHLVAQSTTDNKLHCVRNDECIHLWLFYRREREIVSAKQERLF